MSFYGGSKCPTILRKNKDILLGTVIGLALCSFMNIRMEGMLPGMSRGLAREAAAASKVAKEKEEARAEHNAQAKKMGVLGITDEFVSCLEKANQDVDMVQDCINTYHTVPKEDLKTQMSWKILTGLLKNTRTRNQREIKVATGTVIGIK